MKHFFQLVRHGGLYFVMFFLFTGINPLHAQWVLTNVVTGGSVKALTSNGTNLFSGAMYLGVNLSTDNGTSWSAVNGGLYYSNVLALTVSDTNLFAGTGGGVSLSTNNGTSWTSVNSGLVNTPNVSAVAVSGKNLFAGTSSGIYLSTNNGTSWTAVNSGLINPNEVRTFAVSDTNLFSGSWYVGVYLSTNNGTSWTAVNNGLSNTTVSALAVNGTNLFAGTTGGVYLSTNNGTSWTGVNTGLSNADVRALKVSGTNLFAGTFGGGVFLSTNNGTSWTAVSTGLTDKNVNALTVIGTNLFVGAHSGGVWKRPFSEMITSVEKLSTEFPANITLEQNYPNPFNPSTNIQFQIPQNGFVTLKVYDALGREVVTLANEQMSIGSYNATFNATGLASGVYFYRLQAGISAVMKNMILLK